MNAMQTGEFVAAFREAFGPVPELPLLFRYCLLYTSDAADE